jgi:hypothetical protein
MTASGYTEYVADVKWMSDFGYLETENING